MFSRGPADWHRGGGRGFAGPIMMSRGWGISQATRGTYVKGVTEEGRANQSDGMSWILGLPVPPDNTRVVLPEFIGSTRGGLADGVGILRRKFDGYSKKRKCTYPDVGGRRHDCHSCLQRFDADRDFAKVRNTYALNVDEDRFFELIMLERPEDEEDRLEYPCSWLTAIMRYAGSGKRAFQRLQKTVKKISKPPKDGDLARYLEKL